MVGETVQQRAGAAFRAKHLGPLIERQVGGDQDGAALVALAEDLEEQFRSGGGQGDEAGLCANLSSALSLRTRYHWPVADAFHLYQVVENEVWPIMVNSRPASGPTRFTAGPHRISNGHTYRYGNERLVHRRRWDRPAATAGVFRQKGPEGLRLKKRASTSLN